ncbi:eukaryotic translation initiation factor 2-alpha kinase 1-like isoform X2 [Neocloeon triangulifer]|uniref:eukaryotic translation initiation factor 2-alpha kinase 1-like isoform X2 n=1 Tax=Neocloeon triangulifer TaxID=2078957 RepID=UPI00286FAC6B|nr:eukaryotic translation initiation factor 2-alpha kinase 1-like isoform X2 [Neocloeon triangulifer]
MCTSRGCNQWKNLRKNQVNSGGILPRKVNCQSPSTSAQGDRMRKLEKVFLRGEFGFKRFSNTQHPDGFPSLRFAMDDDVDYLHFEDDMNRDDAINKNFDPTVPSRLLDEFEEFQLIARGGYGVVYKARNITDQCDYAIKLIYHGLIEEALKEVRVHAQLNHLNIVNYKTCWVEPCDLMLRKLIDSSSQSRVSCSSGEIVSSSVPSVSEHSSYYYQMAAERSDSCVLFEDSKTLVPERYGRWQNPKKNTLVIQMEFCGKTMREWLDIPRPSDISRKLWFTYRRLRVLLMFWEIMNGIEHIHLKGIVHHDIKPGNIFVVDGSVIKIGDFGLSCQTKSGIDVIHHDFGTESYAAPEQFNGGLCSTKCDIYSAGLILLEMFFSPFDTVSERHDVLKNLKQHGKIPDLISTDLCQLIRVMTNTQPASRPTASEVKDSLVSLMIPIAEEMYSELMKALTTSIVRKLYLRDKGLQVAPASASAAFMLDILDDLSAIGFIQPSQYEDVQRNLDSNANNQLRNESELMRQKELKVKVMLQNKLRFSRVAGT